MGSLCSDRAITWGQNTQGCTASPCIPSPEAAGRGGAAGCGAADGAGAPALCGTAGADTAFSAAAKTLSLIHILENQLYLNCMNYQTIRQRIAYWAVGIQRIEPGRAVRLPPSQTIFANLLHVSRPSLNQELKQMEREGYFRLESKKMCDVDTPRLSRLL